MWIARVSWNRGDRVIQDALHNEDISKLLEILGRMLSNEMELLEIHIFQEEGSGAKNA